MVERVFLVFCVCRIKRARSYSRNKTIDPRCLTLAPSQPVEDASETLRKARYYHARKSMGRACFVKNDEVIVLKRRCAGGPGVSLITLHQ